MKFVFFHKHIFNSLHLNCKKEGQNRRMLQLYDEFHGRTMRFCGRGSDVFALLLTGLEKNLIFELCHRGRNGTRWSSVSNRAELMTGFPRKHWSLSCISCRFILGGVEICNIKNSRSQAYVTAASMSSDNKSVRFQLLIGSAETIVKSPKS